MASKKKTPKTKTLDEYEAFSREYIKKFGPDTVVWYHCGEFYEMYAFEETLDIFERVVNLFTLRKPKKNGTDKPLSRSNPYMAGIPTYKIDDYVSVLKQNLYTCVIVDQSRPPGPYKREVTRIIGPGFSIGEEDTLNVSNTVMCCYFSEFTTNSTHKILVAGCSVADFSTGNSYFKEFVSSIQERNGALDCVRDEITLKKPNRIILLSESIHLTFILDYLRINTKTTLLQNMLGCAPSCLLKDDYQICLLEEVYPNHGCHIFDYLGIDRYPMARIAFCFVLTEAKKYSDMLIKSFEIPQKCMMDGKMYVSPSCIKHLELFDLEEIINTSVTKIGQRRYRDRIMNPYTSRKKIMSSYDMVENFMPICENVNAVLKKMPDLENIIRRMKGRNLNTKNFYQLHDSLKTFQLLIENASCVLNFDLDKINKIKEEYITKVDVTSEDIKTFFYSGMFPELDAITSKYYKLKADLETLLEEKVKNYQLKITGEVIILVPKNKWEKPKGTFKIEGYEEIDFDKTETMSSTRANYHKISHSILDRICYDLAVINREHEDVSNNLYSDILDRIIGSHLDTLQSMVNYVAEADWFASCASVAKKRKYIRPSIIGKTSHLDLKGLRHPIIEVIQDNVKYITNDIELGIDTKGMLLYGVNGIGKSSMCKSVGLAVLMAQCGLFVACEAMEFYPYKKLFMRSPDGDDLKKGASTFTKEVLELKEIIESSDESTLVIGDELCSGTESFSANTLVQSGLITLYNRGSSFIFATHMHDLPSFPRIKMLEKLRICHFSSRKEGKDIIYDRKLKDGQGDTIYGLEICDAMGMNREFMDLAYKIRGEMMDSDIVSSSSSRYNSKHYSSTCFCGKPCEEDHHIIPQELADEQGFVGSVHKNQRSNLTGVCALHHDQIHAGKIKIDKIQTSSGVKVVVEKKEEEITVAINEKVFELKLKGFTQKKICKELGITLYRLKKVLSEGKK